MRLLIIGDANDHITLASQIAKNHGARVLHCPSIESAIAALCNGQGADLLLVDVRQPIAALVEALNQEHIYLPIVGFGVSADSKLAAQAIRAGAKEYLPLPPDSDLIAAMLESIACDQRDFLFFSDAMKKLVAIADKVAPSHASILITGESGTGKEVIARYIHEKSPRAKQPFISINCAAIPENLLESELFGHEKGAFTGAAQRRIGKFEEANNGTLLLDEISEMDLRLQAKLLRAIQERAIDRVGGSRPVPLNIRILATSNRDLRHEVKQGTFREDLLFRLNVIHLQLPPLRERKADIPQLASFFADKYARLNGFQPVAITDEALTMLEKHSWSGNVRELENTMHRAVLLHTGDAIDVDAIMLDSDAYDDDDAGLLVGKTMQHVEQELILGTVQHCLGNRNKAAEMLGISIRTLRTKLQEYEESV